MKKKVSIVIPAYNAEKFILKCLTSLVNQTYQNIEIIVVNDGSLDNTKDLVKSVMVKDNRVFLVDIQNSGVSNARNKGMEKATGDYLMFVDADDYIDFNAIETMINKYTDNVDLVRMNYLLETAQGKKIAYMEEEIYRQETIKKEEFLDELAKGKAKGYIVLCLFEKKSLNNARFNKDVRFMEDILFYISVLSNEKIKNIALVRDCYYHYIANENSALRSKDNLVKNIEGIITFNKIYKELLEKGNICTTKRLVERDITNAHILASILVDMTRTKMPKQEVIDVCKKIFNDQEIRRMLDNYDFSRKNFSKKLVMQAKAKKFNSFYKYAKIKGLLFNVLNKKIIIALKRMVG